MTTSGVPANKMSDTAFAIAWGLKRSAEIDPRIKNHFGERIPLLDHILKVAVAKRPFKVSLNDFLLRILLLLPNYMQRFFFDKTILKGYDTRVTSRKIAIKSLMENGFEQVVNLGGGYDCGMTLAAASNPRAKFFELDMDGPTRKQKIEALRTFQYDKKINPFNVEELQDETFCSTNNMYYIKCNFITDNLCAALAKAGFDPKKKTLIIAEGLTVYLTEQAARQFFEKMNLLMDNNKSIIFVSILPEIKQSFLLRQSLKSSNELHHFSVPADKVPTYIEQFGLSVVAKYSYKTIKLLDTNNSLGNAYGSNAEMTYEPYYVMEKTNPRSKIYKHFDDIPEISPTLVELKDKKREEHIEKQDDFGQDSPRGWVRGYNYHRDNYKTPPQAQNDYGTSPVINKKRGGCLLQ